MRAPGDRDGSWDTAWLVAVSAVSAAQKVFTPGSRPPGELMPLVEPLIRLREALAAKPLDEAEALRRAHDLVALDAEIAWACEPGRPGEVRELGFILAWLAKILNPAEG
jgi:hypothetical protein